MDKSVRGLLFDLDNTLIDREAAFVRFATCFYEERLRDATLMTRQEVVTRMVRWDEDGYVAREKMFAKWIDEWPETGLDPEQLLPYYRLEMKRHVEPDADNNRLLADPKDRYILKDVIIVDAETNERLGVEGGEEFEHWVDPDEVAEAIFRLTLEQAKVVRNSVPETE